MDVFQRGLVGTAAGIHPLLAEDRRQPVAVRAEAAEHPLVMNELIDEEADIQSDGSEKLVVPGKELLEGSAVFAGANLDVELESGFAETVRAGGPARDVGRVSGLLDITADCLDASGLCHIASYTDKHISPVMCAGFAPIRSRYRLTPGEESPAFPGDDVLSWTRHDSSQCAFDAPTSIQLNVSIRLMTSQHGILSTD